MRKKILYVLGGNHSANGMSSVITQKMNFLAENTDYELTALMTEAPDKPMYYALNPNIKVINFDINFDHLDTMPIYKKIWHYRKKQSIYKRKFTELLLNEHYNVVVSAMRREINFLTGIKDGSKKLASYILTGTFIGFSTHVYFHRLSTRQLHHIGKISL